MKNKAKIFNAGVFLEALNQLKIVGIIACAVYLSAGILTPIGYLINEPYYDVELQKWINITFDSEYFLFLTGIVYLFVPIMMMVIFFWMNKRNSCDFYHAIPVKRETMFISTIAAVFTWALIIIAVAVIVPLVIIGVHPLIQTDMKTFWKIILYIIAGIVLMIGVFSLGISLTGNGFTNVVASLMILIVPRMFITIIVAMIEAFMPFIQLNSGASLLNSDYNVLVAPLAELFTYNESSSVTLYSATAYSCVLGLIYLVLAGIMFKRRRSETASQPSAYNIVQIVCRMVPAFFFSLLGTSCVLETTIRKTYDAETYFVALVWYVVALLVYFIYELITTRRWRKVGASAKQLPIFVGIVIISGLSIGLGTYFAMNREIEPDEIEYIEIEPFDETSYFTRDKVTIKDKDIYELIETAYEEQLDEYYSDYYSYYEDYDIIVGIKQNGEIFYRKIYLDDYEMSKLMMVYMDTLDNTNSSVILPQYDYYNMDLYIGNYPISSEETEELYRILRDEVTSLSFKQLFNVDKYDIITTLEIYYYGDTWNNSFDIIIPISDVTPKSKEYLMSLLLKKAMENDYTEYEYLLESENKITAIDMSFTVISRECTETFYVNSYSEESALSGIQNFFQMLQSVEGDNIIMVDGTLEIGIGNDYYYEWIDGVFRVTDELAEEIKGMATEYYN